jgi:acyl-CoA reductase-like NAD-dependent aldehyde dehydrogenase
VGPVDEPAAKRITLELGGNDGGIVLDDVDPKKVAPGIFEGALQNSGQVCLTIKRLYVHESVYDEICDELVAIAKSTVVDDLGASVWSSDTARAHQVASQIEAGTVWINKHLDMAPHIPFGGAKHSGIGTEFAEEGLAEFTQLQIINEART